MNRVDTTFHRLTYRLLSLFSGLMAYL